MRTKWNSGGKVVNITTSFDALKALNYFTFQTKSTFLRASLSIGNQNQTKTTNQRETNSDSSSKYQNQMEKLGM